MNNQPYLRTRPDYREPEQVTYEVPNMGIARSLLRMGAVIRHHWPNWQKEERKFRMVKLEHDLTSYRLTLETWIA